MSDLVDAERCYKGCCSEMKVNRKAKWQDLEEEEDSLLLSVSLLKD